MSETFLDGKVTLHCGDCAEVLRDLPDASFDAIVTDPPYALVSIVKRFGRPNAAPAKGDVYRRASSGFMSQTWDTGEVAFSVEFWAEAMRVLKPGGHVLAASGTRTYHRLAVAIEDAGFEIRDTVMWNYGSGFPKSHNIVKRLQDSGLSCACRKTIVSSHHVSDENLRDLQRGMDARDALSGDSESDVQQGVHGGGGSDQGTCSRSSGAAGNSVRNLRDTCSPPALAQCAERGDVLQQVVPVADVCGSVATACGEHEGTQSGAAVSGGESGLEGWGDAQARARELQGRPLSKGARVGNTDGAQGRLHHGASPCDGEDVRVPAHADGGRAPSGQEPREQSPEQLGALADQRRAQIWGGWPVCPSCCKPVVPEGYGTALKPACEPWVLARKPLIGTVAANVLQFGTGALNIGACRVGTDDNLNGGAYAKHGSTRHDGDESWRFKAGGGGEYVAPSGRWPANVLHDGSDEVVAGFPETGTGGLQSPGDRNGGIYGAFGERSLTRPDRVEGSASRFFYTAKADGDERIGSSHPTVKPLDLMQYLCRLITPPGGRILDPFAGTGTTGEAAWREGFHATLIERETAYQEDIRRRMALAVTGPETRATARVAAKGTRSLGPLFD